jgi:hypothetical protein
MAAFDRSEIPRADRSRTSHGARGASRFRALQPGHRQHPLGIIVAIDGTDVDEALGGDRRAVAI